MCILHCLLRSDDQRQEKERHQLQLTKCMEEKTRSQSELTQVEQSFKDLRLRYEEQKTLLEKYKASEAILKKTIENLQTDVIHSEKRVDAVKAHAEQKLTEANTELNRLKQQYDSDLSRMKQQYEDDLALTKAKLTKAESKVRGLEGQVEQKQKENDELVAICDDLIQKMEKNGGNSGGDSIKA